MIISWASQQPAFRGGIAATLSLSAATDTLTAPGYSGAPYGLFSGNVAPKYTFNAAGNLAQQNQLFRTQTESRAVSVPDASGGDPGQGFTVTGIADGGTFWLIGNDGTNKETATPQVHLTGLVKVDKVSNLNIGEIRLDLLYSLGTTATTQGVVIDPTDGTYWCGMGANGIKHVSPAGAALSGSFTTVGGNANGVGYDALRNYLLVFRYVSSTNSSLERYTRSGNTWTWLDTTTIPNTPDGDHVFYDAARDYIWLTYGPNGGTVNGAVAYKASDLSYVGTTIFPTAQAIEGLAIVNGEFVICHDGYFHGWSSGALPKNNQLQFYPAVLGKTDVAWSIDYDPVSHALLGYSFEPQFIRLSGDPITQAAIGWNKSTGLTVTALNAVSPTSATDANTVTSPATNIVHEISRGSSSNVNPADKIIVHDMVKAGTYTGNLWFGDRADSPIRSATVNISTGAVVGSSNCTCTVLNMGNGWFRVTRTYSRAAATGVVGANVAYTGASHVLDRVAQNYTSTGGGTYQIYAHEIGVAEYATTPVFAAIAPPETRAADVDAWPNVAWMGATANTLTFAATTARGVATSTNQVLWQIDDGSESNRYRIVRDSSRVLRFIVTVSGSDVVNLSLGAVADYTSFKLAVSAKFGAFAASLNGAAPVTTASGTLPVVTTTRAGRSFTDEAWSGWLKSVIAYPTDTAGAALQALST